MKKGRKEEETAARFSYAGSVLLLCVCISAPFVTYRTAYGIAK